MSLKAFLHWGFSGFADNRFSLRAISEKAKSWIKKKIILNVHGFFKHPGSCLCVTGG